MTKIYVVFCLFFLVGCQPGTKFTTSNEYIEEKKWDKEKGQIETSKGGTVTVSWK